MVFSFASSRRTGRFVRAGAAVGVVAAALCACQSSGPDPSANIAEYRDRMLVEHQEQADQRQASRERPDEAIQIQNTVRPADGAGPARESLLTQPTSSPASTPSPLDVLTEIPDPRFADQVFEQRFERIQTSREQRVKRSYEAVVAKARDYLKGLALPRQQSITLAECIQRALANNYTIRIEAYGPAISRTQLVEAEAVFDAVFFLDSSIAERDDPEGGPTPTGTGQADVRSYGGGFRKLLPTGMSVQTSLRQTRTDIRFPQKQTAVWDPAWDSIFQVQFNQPLLRGFGLDYNRAPIEIARAGTSLSYEQFLTQVREQLIQVEQAFWELSRARREVLVRAEAVAQNFVTYENMKQRLTFDATEVEVSNANARWKSSEVTFQIAVKTVRDAEDALKNLLNDPTLLLSDLVELIPVDTPLAAPMAVDQFASVRTSLDERSEIRQARLALEQSRVRTLRAKNETLPRLDVSFSYDVSGGRQNADDSFDELSTNRYLGYSVGAVFEVPIGQRAARAALRRANMEESQSVIRIQQVTDGVVQEVNNAIRNLFVTWQNIPTQLEAVQAADRNLRALQERSEAVSPSFLETELSAVEQLANTRSSLLRLVMGYNVSVADLERAKGTLLRYNNVIPRDETTRR